MTTGPITFGNRTVYPPPGLSSYTTDVDVQPGQDLIVRVGVSLDLATGILGWSVTSLDPLGLPLDDEEGFLPPNDATGRGEGSVLFTVMPKVGLAGGTAIRNRATIDFDGEALLTPEWANLLDTTATADTIGAPGGRTYSFYSLARDSSGNLEPVPETPDVETFSRVAVDERVPLRLALEGAVPNPAVGAARVWFTLPSRERAVLEVVDVAGRRVLRRDVGTLGPGRHVVDVSAATRRPGLYFLKLAQGGQTRRARMALVR